MKMKKLKKDFLDRLTEFVSIPSVSTDLTYLPYIEQATEWLSSYLIRSGLDVEIIRGYENPIVVAKTPYDPARPTILVYGHYDVQPANMTDGWKSDPFTITKRKAVLYARGIADNKAQILSHISSVAELMKKDRLGFNVTFLIEGNEETGSAQLEKFVRKNKKMLASDCILVSDSELMKGNTPAIEISFRGSANFTMTVTTGTEDMHSGLFGGVTANAAEEIGKIIGSISQFTGQKNGFKPSATRYEKRRSLEQTVEVTGLSSGYISEGFRNSIPCRATAKINIRSTPTQDIKALLTTVQKFLRQQASPYTKVTFTNDRYCNGAEFDIANIFAQRALKVLQKVYGQKPQLKTSGGTLPIAYTFQKVLKVPQIMIPIGDYDCGAHGASEHISIDVLEKGLRFSSEFFSL